MLPFLQAVIGDMVSLVAVVAILGGIIKLFQMGTSLNEIRDLLVEIKRNTSDYSTTANSVIQPYTSESRIQAAESRPEPSFQSAILERES